MIPIGLAVMAVSLWLLFDQQLYMQNIGGSQNDYYVGTYIILAIGGIMTLVGKLHIFIGFLRYVKSIAFKPTEK